MIVILGPGRSGTTFLWELFRNLGYETGPHAEFLRAYSDEISKNKIKFPKVIKGTGGLCVNFLKHTKGHNIGHIFFCIRSFEPLLARQIKMKKNRGVYKGMTIPHLEKVLIEEIPRTVGLGLLNIIEHPYSIVKFPESAQDPEYLFDIINKAGYCDDKNKFQEIWKKTVKPDLIHAG